jgi:hypothetical protein
MRIRIQFQIQGFDDQKLKKKFTAGIFFYFFDQKLQFTYLQASLKDAQATGEVFNPKKKHIQHCKTRKFFPFFIFVVHFCLPGFGSGSSDSN